MAYKALYRIYRPKTFDDVVGQKHILQTLRNAIKENKIAHAYLFSGPRGTGKTSMAKLLAKGLNCTCEDASLRPCNACSNCLSVNDSSHPDVIELDAASNNGVDEVRDLIDKVKYAPTLGKYKVYIIDEVHMMTQGAFNALLKTLEEPPAHVVFILATTDVHKVIPTIVSRCQRFDFNRVNNVDMKERIKHILKSEDVKFEESVIDIIVELAEGGMRDALSILDQAIAYAGKDLTSEHIRDIYGIATNREMVNFLNLAINNEVSKLLTSIDDFEAKGIDFSRLTAQLVDIVKEVIVYKKTNSLELMKKLTQSDVEVLKDVKIKTLFKIIDILTEALTNYRKVNNPLEYFTLASLKIAEINSSEEEVIYSVSKKEEVKVKPQKEVKVETKPTSTIYETVVEKKEEVISKKVKSSKTHKILFDENDLLNIAIQSSKIFKQEVIEKWVVVREYLNHAPFARASNLLIDGQPVIVAKNAIIFGFDSPHQAELVNIYENQLIIKDLLKEIYNRDYYFYGISDEKFQNLKMRYRMLAQEGALPEPVEIKEPRHEKIEEDEEEDEELKQGRELFGEMLKIED